MEKNPAHKYNFQLQFTKELLTEYFYDDSVFGGKTLKNQIHWIILTPICGLIAAYIMYNNALNLGILLISSSYTIIGSIKLSKHMWFNLKLKKSINYHIEKYNDYSSSTIHINEKYIKISSLTTDSETIILATSIENISKKELGIHFFHRKGFFVLPKKAFPSQDTFNEFYELLTTTFINTSDKSPIS